MKHLLHVFFQPFNKSLATVGLFRATDLLQSWVQLWDCHSQFIFNVQFWSVLCLDGGNCRKTYLTQVGCGKREECSQGSPAQQWVLLLHCNPKTQTSLWLELQSHPWIWGDINELLLLCCTKVISWSCTEWISDPVIFCWIIVWKIFLEVNLKGRDVIFHAWDHCVLQLVQLKERL